MSKQEWGYYATPEKMPLDFLMSNLIQSKIKVYLYIYIPMCGSTYFEFLVCIPTNYSIMMNCCIHPPELRSFWKSEKTIPES